MRTKRAGVRSDYLCSRTGEIRNTVLNEREQKKKKKKKKVTKRNIGYISNNYRAQFNKRW